MKLIRDQLNDVWAAAELKDLPAGMRVTIAGSVTCRQRPGTASGVVFITLEDETGTANAIVWPKLFERERLIINLEPALVITGKLQNESGVIRRKGEFLKIDVASAAAVEHSAKQIEGRLQAK